MVSLLGCYKRLWVCIDPNPNLNHTLIQRQLNERKTGPDMQRSSVPHCSHTYHTYMHQFTTIATSRQGAVVVVEFQLQATKIIDRRQIWSGRIFCAAKETNEYGLWTLWALFVPCDSPQRPPMPMACSQVKSKFFECKFLFDISHAYFSFFRTIHPFEEQINCNEDKTKTTSYKTYFTKHGILVEC